MLILTSAVGLYWFRLQYDDRVYPAVSVQGVAVGGMSYREAKAAIDQRAQAIEGSTATFLYGGKSWNPTLAELGVTVDTESTLDAAFGIGREADARARIRSIVRLLREDRSVPLRVTIDATKLQAWFDVVDGELGVKPRDAMIVVEDGQVRIVPEVKGVVVDRDQVTELLVSGLRTLEPPSGLLPIIAKDARVHAADLEPARRQLEQALAEPVTLTYQRKSWTLSPAELGQFVIQEIDETRTGSDAVSVTLDRKALARWLAERIGGEVNREPVDAVVAWDFEKQRVFAVKPSKEGAKLRPTTLADEVTASFFSDHRTVKVPITVLQPKVDSANLDALGITTRLAAGSSNFAGSDEGRAHNIRVGAQKLNGHLVPPGGVFSFNRGVGIISVENGFVESNVVDGERIGRDVGGGICQVSTTVFRAALYAGLPITEWWPHRYRLGFYELDGWPMGLDASILQPEGDPFGGGDFAFRNPTDSWLLIESYTDGTRVVVIIYGPDLGYSVEVEGPIMGATYPPTKDIEVVDSKLPAGTIVQTEWAQQGYDVTYVRRVSDRDGNLVLEDRWYTHFYPRGNVYTVSPDMRGFSPAGAA